MNIQIREIYGSEFLIKKSIATISIQELGDGETGIEWEEYEVSGEHSLPIQNHASSATSKHSPSEVHRSSYK